MIKVEFDIRQISEVREVLNQIAPSNARKLITNTNYRIAARLRDAVRRNAPTDKGDLKRSITARNMRTGNPDRPVSIVYFKDPGYHWRFVEKGTNASKKRGAQRPQPFLQPAIDAIVPQLPEIINVEFTATLEKLIKRELKKRER